MGNVHTGGRTGRDWVRVTVRVAGRDLQQPSKGAFERVTRTGKQCSAGTSTQRPARQHTNLATVRDGLKALGTDLEAVRDLDVVRDREMDLEVVRDREMDLEGDSERLDVADREALRRAKETARVCGHDRGRGGGGGGLKFSSAWLLDCERHGSAPNLRAQGRHHRHDGPTPPNPSGFGRKPCALL